MMRPRLKGFARVSQESVVALGLAMVSPAMPRWFGVGGLLAVSVALGGIAQAQSTCDAGVTKAVAKKVSCKLKVFAAAQRTGIAVDATRLTKCEDKFTQQCAGAQSKGACSAQARTCVAIEAAADACVDTLAGGSSTTSTTTTTTTTTTIPRGLPTCSDEGTFCGSCGDGLCVQHCPSTDLVCISVGGSTPGCSSDGACTAGQVCGSVPSAGCTTAGCATPCF